MSYFKIEKAAEGVTVSESDLAGAQPVTVTLSDGSVRYVEGGFGSLWRAGAHGEYAVKRLRGDDMDAARREFELLSRLNGRGFTPTVFCVGTLVDDEGVGSPAIVESYVSGRTLEQAINGGFLSGSAGTGCNARSASIVALAVAEVLRGLAEAGVAHRDLSAANIMLSRRCLEAGLAGGAEVVLVDFGQSTSAARGNVTPAWQSRLATVPYGAPEVFGGRFRKMRNGPTCDTWSLGAIIVAMMAAGEYWPESIANLRGACDLGDKDPERIAEAKREPLDLVEIAGLAAPSAEERALADIVRSCTEYDPRLRPSLEGIIAALREYVGLAPEATTPDFARPRPDAPDAEAEEAVGERKSTGKQREVDGGVSGSGRPKGHIVGVVLIVIAIVVAVIVGVVVASGRLEMDNSKTASGRAASVVSSESDEGDVSDDADNDDAASQTNEGEQTEASDGGVSTSTRSAPSSTVNLDGYGWAELKAIADEIAAADSDEAGLEVAKSYGLVDSDGKLQGDRKALTLADGTECMVRIAGFRHDDRSDGSGKAGITFEFADVPKVHKINSSQTNKGGWESSAMRSWLNNDFYDLLPDSLKSDIVEVVKKTNNEGGEVKGNAGVVSGTPDKLWLLSKSEVYGMLSSQSSRSSVSPYSEFEVYNAEGTQYKLYADQGVSDTYNSFSAKDGAAIVWWLRSPTAHVSFAFLYVGFDGDWFLGTYPDCKFGVSPGFCF